METLVSMDFYTPEKCKKPNKNTQNGGIGCIGT
jgi:hypothetical protein